MNVYFDNAATTPLNPLVLEKMLPYLKSDFGNPSSIHSFGRKIRVVIEESREVVADFINADPSEIYFTSGGTESINFAINGIARTEFNESGKNELISSPSEHSAVLDTNKSLELSGFKYIELEVEKDSSVNLDSLSNSLTDNTSLVSIMYTNNESGAINNVSEIANRVKNNNSYFHCDAVQAIGKIRINVDEFKVDALSATAHKIYGPKGTGFLYVRSGTPLSPLLLGGSQERNRRAGTENVAGIVGLAETIRFADAKMEENEKSVRK
ncbi:MAG: cysteine desulfurase, partial [Melioribacteraceae bacterium]|nr:cysteine desulfurase [Melioribacteraceae bacterium]